MTTARAVIDTSLERATEARLEGGAGAEEEKIRQRRIMFAHFVWINEREATHLMCTILCERVK